MEKCDCCCVIKKKCKVPKISYQKQVDCCQPRYGTILGAMRQSDGSNSKCCGEMGDDDVYIKRQPCALSAMDRAGHKLMVALSCDKFDKKIEDPCGDPCGNTKKPPCCGPSPCNEPKGNGKPYCPPAPCCGQNDNFQEKKGRGGGRGQCGEPVSRSPNGNGDQAGKNNVGREYIVCMPKCPEEPQQTNNGNCQEEDQLGKKLIICMPCNQELPMGNVKVYLPPDNAPQKQPKRVKDYMYRCESRELLGSKLLSYCECVKRNGLQDQCPRTPCRGRPACLVKPWPDCWPSGGCYGQDYERPKGFERFNPALQYRRDNKVCPPKDAVPDVKVVVQHC